MSLPVFDFETRSEAGYLWDAVRRKWGSLPGFDAQKRGLSAVGVRVYLEHATFAPQLLYYDLTPEHDGATGVQWELGQSFDRLAPLFWHIEQDNLIEAQNAGFEYQIWNYFCVPVWKWPRLKISQMRCSAVKARAAGWPGKLAPLTEVLNTPIRKDAAGDKLMKLFSIPRNPTKKDGRTMTLPHEAPADWARYKSYNRDDGRSEYQASIRLPELPVAEQEIWVHNQEINDRGMAVDRTGIQDCIAVVEQAYSKFGQELHALTGGIKATELAQLQKWLAGQGVHMPDMQAKTIEERLDDPELTGPARRVLELRTWLGSASVKKLYALNASTASDGRVHDMYQMHATHHGRTGGYGPQPSNLYKGEWHTPDEVEAALAVIGTRSLAAVEAAYPTIGPLEVVNNCLRSLFVAGPRKVLVSSDYQAIEGVVLAALAGEDWILEVFRTHGMYYEAQIARMTGTPLQELIDYKVRTGKHHPLRQQGKLAVLSGGYGSWVTGWKKFGADKYYNSDKEIKAAIMSYWESTPAITEFRGGQTRDKFKWNEREELFGLEGAAIQAIRDPSQSFAVGVITFQMDTAQDTLFMRLPSGRFIQYHNPSLRPSSRNYATPWEVEISYWGWDTEQPAGWKQLDLYGGVLTQNACGGTARDIQQHGMLNAKRRGYDVVMETYDETVAEVPIGFGSIEEFEGCLNDLPDYAKGWPVKAVGGWMLPRYGKWEL